MMLHVCLKIKLPKRHCQLIASLSFTNVVCRNLKRPPSASMQINNFVAFLMVGVLQLAMLLKIDLNVRHKSPKLKYIVDVENNVFIL